MMGLRVPVSAGSCKKRYLQELAVAIILEMVGKLPVETVLNHVLEAPGLEEWFAGATEAGNPDALLLALKESTFGQPRVHGVWPVLISYLLPDLGQGVESEDGVAPQKKPKVFF